MYAAGSVSGTEAISSVRENYYNIINVCSSVSRDRLINNVVFVR